MDGMDNGWLWQVDGWMGGWVDDWWMDGWMDRMDNGWIMDEWQVDGWMDEGCTVMKLIKSSNIMVQFIIMFYSIHHKTGHCLARQYYVHVLIARNWIILFNLTSILKSTLLWTDTSTQYLEILGTLHVHILVWLGMFHGLLS